MKATLEPACSGRLPGVKGENLVGQGKPQYRYNQITKVRQHCSNLLTDIYGNELVSVISNLKGNEPELGAFCLCST